MTENLITYYKELHKIPEIGFYEFKTQKYILDKIKLLNCKIHELNPTGLIAFFDYGSKESIAFRCEMDGLEIYEKNDLEYKSTHEGYMHGCGHDGHMAIMLCLAERLQNIRCPRNICLIFQPSEEKYGGALSVIESKILSKYNVKEIYGLHLWPNLKRGVIASRSKTMMASSTEIDITIVGKESHIANKENGIDAIMTSFELLSQINNQELLFNCGKITSIGARNVVCSRVTLECSLRSFYEIKRKSFLKDLNMISLRISQNNKSNIYIDKKRYIPIVKNDLILFEKHRHLIDEVIAPVWQSEDFSFYNNDFKCLYLFLGLGNTSGLHCNDFMFDLSVLEKGLSTFLKIALTP